MRRADLGQVAKDLVLELWDLRNSLNNEVDGRQILNLGASSQQRTSLISLLLGDSLLRNILCQKLFCV